MTGVFIGKKKTPKKVNFFRSIVQKYLQNTKFRRIFVLLKDRRSMKSLTEKEKELIEAIRNFKASLGRMENPFEFEWYIYQLLHELMGI